MIICIYITAIMALSPRNIARELYNHLYDTIIENAYAAYYTYANKSLPSLRRMQDERAKLIHDILSMCYKYEEVQNYMMQRISEDTHAIYEHLTAGALIRRYYFDDFVCGIVGGIANNAY